MISIPAFYVNLKQDCKTLILRKKVNFLRLQQQTPIKWGCNHGQLSRVIGTRQHGVANLNDACKTQGKGEGGLIDISRCGPATKTLIQFKTKISDFPTLFKTEF